MKLETALTYRNCGFSVVPVLPKRKKPATHLINRDWKQFQSVQPTEDELRGWFGRYADLNLAVVCGDVSGGLFVLDFDHNSRETIRAWFKVVGEVGAALPIVKTGKGYHLYFRYPATLSSGILAKSDEAEILIELRGENTLCMLAGSTHGNGANYHWVRGSENVIPILNARQVHLLLGGAAQLNQEKEKIYIPKKSLIEPAVPKNDPYVMAAMKYVVDELSSLRSGRNHALNGSAYRLGRFVGSDLLSTNVVEEKLRGACETNGYIAKDGEQAFLATLNSGLSAGMQDPF